MARGAGTGLSGGCLPAEGGIVISLMRMNRVLEVDDDNQIAAVEPGLVNLHLSQTVGPRGYYYAPDPSSQQACTIGGNIGAAAVRGDRLRDGEARVPAGAAHSRGDSG